MKPAIMKYAGKTCILAATFLFGLNAYSQEIIEKYVKANTSQVQSIDPDSVEFGDLQAIGNAIGDAKVVMLGEQDHGDAPTFLAKSRLIKYLHEKKGFNVLAFEGDFFRLNYDWDSVKKNKDAISSFIKKSIYPLWTNCSSCKELFYNYIPSTFTNGVPLQLAGFDPQMGTVYPTDELDKELRSLKVPITTSANYQTEVLPALKNWAGNMKDTALNAKYLGYLTRIKSELSEKLPPDDFWLLLIDNLFAQHKEFLAIGVNYWEDHNIRDRQMALNLAWLVQHKYSNQKIIVWAHNYHISKYAGHFEEDFLNPGDPMGNVFTTSGFADKTYIIGFTSYEGTTGRLFYGNSPGKKYKVDSPRSNSFERWIESSYDYAFVDFRKFNQQYSAQKDISFYMSGAVKGSWYHKNHKATWNQIFDGVFFIRKMYPCEKI